jgi:hypothetical protein
MNYSVFKKGLYRMLEPPCHVKAMSNVGVGKVLKKTTVFSE